MRLKRDSWIPTTVTIPGEDIELPLKIKVLDSKEGIDLRSRYREAENAKEEDKAKYWCPLLEDSFRRFVRIDCDELIIERDGVDVAIDSAEKLLPFYGGEIAMINTIFTSILAQARLTLLQKKHSPSDTASLPSSDEPGKEALGPKPETTATSAGNGDSAGSEDASSPAVLPSGSTEESAGKEDTTPSSSTNAPSSP